MRRRALIAVGMAALGTSPAEGLCIYHGVDNAKTTVEQEFRDSRWVVRAHVVSADYHWSDEDESWTLYRLRVVTSFKGRLPNRFMFFTTRDSGGFYLDGPNAVPDVDGDYLLFLTPVTYPHSLPPAARGALDVNYNCGQSKAWRQVSAGEARRLRSLSSSR
jgi:hypothetical protein